METWNESMGVGIGLIYLKDKEATSRYHQAVTNSLVESHAKRIVSISSRSDRISALKLIPESMRLAVQAKVLELWSEPE